MNINYKQLLINKRKSLHLTLIDMSKRVGVSMPALHNYEQGLSVSDSSEQKIIEWVEGAI